MKSNLETVGATEMTKARSANVELIFEAHREMTDSGSYDGQLAFVHLEGKRGGGPSNSYLSFHDVSRSFFTDAHIEDETAGDYGNWFALEGGFVLPDEFTSDHPVFRALVGVGFDPEMALIAIGEAIACAIDEDSDE